MARLELPFDRAHRAALPAATAAACIVVRGDNLWNIARAHYGEGLRYTMIFDANKDQIRDPNLIYPGQNLQPAQGQLTRATRAFMLANFFVPILEDGWRFIAIFAGRHLPRRADRPGVAVLAADAC